MHPYSKKISTFSSEILVPVIKIPAGHWKKLLKLKTEHFSRTGGRKNRNIFVKSSFTVQDVIDKFGENPKCYLTGREINICDSKSYQFDHKIPKSRGGDNSLDNLGICCTAANQAKHSLTKEEFLELCKEVLTYNGIIS